MKPNIKYADTI